MSKKYQNEQKRKRKEKLEQLINPLDEFYALSRNE